MIAIIAILALAAPVPDKLVKMKPPEVRHTGTVERGGHVYLQFEVINPNSTILPYIGYTSGSFEGGLKEGVISPLYRVETKQGKEWTTQQLGWCGTGRGPVSIPAKGKGTFSVSTPDGNWDEARIGITWFTGPDRKTSDVTWGVVSRKNATPKKP